MTANAPGGPAAAVLARSAVFAGWPAAALAAVASRFRPRVVAAGEVICRQGEPGDELYVVEAGRFAVELTRDGQTVRLVELGPGTVFGEIAVVTRRSRTATVRSLAAGRLWALGQSDFAALAGEYPALGAAVSRLAAERLAIAEQQVQRVQATGAAPRPTPAAAPPPVAQPDADIRPAEDSPTISAPAPDFEPPTQTARAVEYEPPTSTVPALHPEAPTASARALHPEAPTDAAPALRSEAPTDSAPALGLDSHTSAVQPPAPERPPLPRRPAPSAVRPTGSDLPGQTLHTRAVEGIQFTQEPEAVLELRPSQDTVTIGRDGNNDLVLADPRVSRFHALLRRVGDRFRVEDLGSTNGVFVNGERVVRRDLADGDRLWIGGQVLRFDASELTRYARGRGAQVDAVELVKVVGKGVTILDHVSLSAYPGELVAIVGGSGAGKTTLLTALAGVAPPSTGRVLYNGDDYYRHFQAYRQVLGYVPQDDIVHPELSVARTLRFAARLRLPADTSAAEIDARISAVLDRLDLAPRRDTEVRRLSGGQRKRVSIAVELLTEPEVFYLDEPTSGLDPGLDFKMMQLLRALADQGRTVVLTTHATRNVMLCDKVAFMARGGRLAFYGPPADALAHFGVDDFVDIYTALDPDGAPEREAARFRASPAYQRHVAQRLDANAAVPTPGAPRDGSARPRPARGGGPGWARQLFWLTARFLAVLKGDRIALGVLLAAAPLIGLVIGSTFAEHPFERSFEAGGDVSQAIALIYVMTASIIFLASFVAARSIAEESAIYARERLVNLQIVPYVLSKVLGLGLFALVQAALLLGVVALRLDIPGGTRTLLDWYGTLVLTGLASLGMGLAVSAVSTNTLRAMLLHSVALNPQLFLCGALVPLKQLDEGSRAIADLTIGRWAVSLLGYYADMNGLLDAQLGANDYTEQFDLDPARTSAVFGAMFLAFVLLAILALKRRDVRR